MPPSLAPVGRAESQLNDDEIELASSTQRFAHIELPDAHRVTAEQDGGLRAWLQVAGSFLIYCNLWGPVFSFGSFQSYYELTYLPASSPSAISWIGTIASFLLITGGVITGPFFDKGYFRAMLLAGLVLETTGLLLLSFCTTYWPILITQGLMVGCGSALLYVPGLALVGRAFKKHVNVALALTTSGAPVGGIIYTLIFEQLIPKLGFAWTVRAMALVMGVLGILALPLLLWKVENLGNINTDHRHKMIDRSALTDLPFWSFITSSFLIDLGYWVPFVYLASYGQSELGMTQDQALNIIIIAQATSIIGRLLSGLAAAHLGVMVLWLFSACGSGICCIAWLAVNSSNSLIAMAAIYGATSGALIPLPAALFTVVCPDRNVYGVQFGMAQALIGVASLIGSPIAGALSNVKSSASERAFLGLQLFSGIVMIAGACNLVQLWTSLLRHRVLEKKLI